MTRHGIQDELQGIAIFIGVMWGVFLIDWVLPIDLNQYGVVPRSLRGLIGIPISPFLHANLTHLAGNTVPLAVLLTLLAGSRADSRPTVAAIILASGGLLWVIGRGAASGVTTVHVGASGLIYGLIAFLIVAGVLERRFLSIVVAIAVAFVYGSTLLVGVLPTVGSQISWDGHLAGAIAGAVIARMTIRRT
ncbi:MAG: rhomboid family intramembrane serine protease [Pirellulaceae bacterium]